jgi:Uma2 family endonuclease
MPGDSGLIVGREPDTVRGAEVVYFSYERLPREITPTSFTTVPPDLVAEIVGHRQGWREAAVKTDEYLAMGVYRVWIVDAKAHRVHVCRAGAEPVVLDPRDTLSDEDILPGFTCRVDELFAG